MNDVTQQKNRETILKSLAITGFISIIVLIAWASVKLVNLVPSAFSSLASLAESMSQFEKKELSKDSELATFTVTSNTKLIDTKNIINLSWSTTDTPGSFVFNYQCVDGVSIDLVNVTGIGAINCDSNYNIGNTDKLSLLVNSEKTRYQDVNYSISFLGTNDTAPRAIGKANFTIINTDITDLDSNTEVVIETSPEESTNENIVATTSESTAPSPVKPTPVYEQEFVYTIPTSDPNGKTDLATKFIAFGNIVGNTFVKGEIKQAKNGAIQFEVKNYGTKTSAKWTYTVTLPTGETYNSVEQAALKPNERAVITIGFPTSDKTSFNFKVNVLEKTDKNLLNNQFSQTAKFIN